MIRWQHWWRRYRLAGIAVGVTVAAAAIVPMARMAQVSAATEPCVVSYQVNQWTGGFTAQLGMTNNGAPLNGWTLTWTFDGNQQITSAWNAQVTQSGAMVRATNLAYDGSVATGGTVSLGFQGTFSGSNDAPANFAVNGVACNGGSPSPSPSVTTPGAPCSATVFCDSFEDQAGTVPSGRWSVSTPDCSGTGAASVDSTVAHSGGKSVRINGGASYCNHVFIADTADMAAAGPDVFVRFWVMHNTPLPAGHVTFLAMTDAANGNTSLRLGGQNGALMWNRQSDDATLPDQSPAGVAQSMTLPVNSWECIEFEINSTNGHINTWVNGTSVPGLTEDGVPTPDIDNQWLADSSWRPRLTDLRLGWESYASETDTLWFDDVALSSARIGCLHLSPALWRPGRSCAVTFSRAWRIRVSRHRPVRPLPAVKRSAANCPPRPLPTAHQGIYDRGDRIYRRREEVRNMRRRRRAFLASMCAVTAALGGALLFAVPASAHGAMEIPGSRTYLCYEDAITSTGQLVPHNPACQAAVANSGVTPLYNWFAVGNNKGATSGETVGFIPDGKLCSGNSNYFDFSGFDQASPDWPKTHLTAGSTIQIQYNKWAAHPGTFSLYITKPGWDPTQPLTWADLEPMPFSTATDPPSVGNPGSINSYYYWNATLPSGYTGYHIIYSMWARSDSVETFYGCSDVVFDGGNGQVTGIGSTAPPPTETPCTATYSITNTWPGGFQGQVTVANPTTSTMYGWTVSWVLADGETVSSSWNGNLSVAGSLATMKNANWNNTLPAGGSTTFGFAASQSSTPVVPGTVSCQSP